MVYVLLSPAKTMVFDRARPHMDGATPYFQKHAVTLAAVLAKMGAAKIGKLMAVSDKLAKLNDERFKAFAAKPSADATDLAILAFRGDTYIGLDAKTLTDAQLKKAQKHIGMLSGLYGVLSPLDLIQPYRLEMGSALTVNAYKNLYGFWGDAITKRVNALVKENKSRAVIGCASNEYLSAVNTDALDVPFIQCDFKEIKNGKATTVGLFAKRARGMMARFVVEHDIKDADALKKFNGGGYAFDKKASTDGICVFTR